jgi:predicted RNase H-like HicB family nuclease
MKTFKYDIVIEALVPPIGETLKFMATVPYLYESHDGKQTRISSPVAEVRGDSRDEARANLKARLDEWISAQNLGA